MTWFCSALPRVRQRKATTLTTRRYRIGAVLVALVILLSSVPAYADPISDKQAEATRIQRQIGALDTKAEIATENYNRAADRYAKLSRKVRTTSRQLSRIQAKMSKLQSHLYTRADDMYRSGPLGFLEVLLNAKSFDEFNKTWDLLTDMNTQDAASVKDLRSARQEARQYYAVLKASQAAAETQKTAMAKNKKAVLAQLAQRKKLLAGVNAEIRNLLAAKQAEEAASARRAYLTSSRGGSAWVDPGGNPPSNLARGATVVWWAKSRLGSPYVWAASGPNEFDCSGLAMWCYDKVGVSLPHSSAEQYNSGQHVSQANLEPGDLVFFGRSGIHHVGIYVGGGQMIEAPHSGAVVRYANAFRDDYAGACRP